jgi:hypothetical protein
MDDFTSGFWEKWRKKGHCPLGCWDWVSDIPE